MVNDLEGNPLAGAKVEDAVLARAHLQAAQYPAVAEEFVAFFLADLARLGSGQLSTGLRRFLDTGDLVQSVLGDLWPGLLELRFETRDQFLALLAARLRWKATDRARGLQAGRRREDLRVPTLEDEAASGGGAPSPPTQAGQREDWERLVLVLARLPDRDRELLSRSLRGQSLPEIAAAMDLEAETARKAVQRALAKARQLAGVE